MPERLTPERIATIEADYQRGCAFTRDIEAVFAQAARDARTLARVQAWTEEDVPLRVKVGNYTMRRSVLSVTADRVTRLAVAALLRAEEED